MLCEVLSTRSCKSSRGVHKVPLSLLSGLNKWSIWKGFMSAAPGFYNELIFLHVHVLHFSCKYGFCVCIYELIIQAVLVMAYLSRCYQPVYHTCTCMCLIRLTVILTGNLNFTTYWFFVLCLQVFVWSSDKERSS